MAIDYTTFNQQALAFQNRVLQSLNATAFIASTPAATLAAGQSIGLNLPTVVAGVTLKAYYYEFSI